MKKLALLLVTVLLISVSSVSEAYGEITMYAPDGRTAVIPSEQLSAWKNVGWYDYAPTVSMYAPDGRVASVETWNVDAWKAVGWHTSPFITVYSADGRSIRIPTEDVYKYRNVGWYLPTEIAKGKNLYQLQKHFGNLNFYTNWSGGDYYINQSETLIFVFPYKLETGSCVLAGINIKELIPQLNAYADQYGSVSVSALKTVLNQEMEFYYNEHDECHYYKFVLYGYTWEVPVSDGMIYSKSRAVVYF